MRQSAEEFEAENARLKKLVANQSLDIDMFKELAERRLASIVAAVPLVICSRGSGLPGAECVASWACTARHIGSFARSVRTKRPGCGPSGRTRQSLDFQFDATADGRRLMRCTS